MEGAAEVTPPAPILGLDAVRCSGPGSLLSRCVRAALRPLLQPVQPYARTWTLHVLEALKKELEKCHSTKGVLAASCSSLSLMHHASQNHYYSCFRVTLAWPLGLLRVLQSLCHLWRVEG